MKLKKLKQFMLPMFELIKESCLDSCEAYSDDGPSGFERFIFDKEYSTESFWKVSHGSKIVEITFRGTDKPFEWPKVNFKIWMKSIKNWISDHKLVIPYPDTMGKSKIKVFTGMFNKYMSFRDQFHTRLAPYLDDGYIFILSGHSQGSPIAVFAGLDLNYNYGSTVLVNKNASCKEGNKAFKKSAEKRILINNLHTKGDLIYFAPPLLGYRHCGNKYTMGPWKLISIKAHRPEYYKEQVNKL